MSDKSCIKFLFLIFLLIIFSCPSLLADEASLPKAANFTLPYLKGSEKITLFEILPKSKLTVLIFFNSECDECLETIASLKNLPAEIEKIGISAQVYGINFDSEQLSRVRSFVKGEKISFPILSDVFQSVAAS